jgi:3-phosphoshikimate 1-carboxyvinyltransferase
VLRVAGGGAPLRGRFRPPGDKSLTHRSFLFAALAHGASRVRGANEGADCAALLAALRALGVAIHDGPAGEIAIEGRGPGAWRSPGAPLDLGNSGTALRLLAGAIAPLPIEAILTGDDSLRRRPMLRVVEPLRAMGARIDGERGGDRAPLTVRGGPLRGIRYVAPVPSAQVKSAVLLAGLGAEGATSVVEPVPSRDHTERLLKAMGAALAFCDGTARLTPGKPLAPIDWDVPADPSGAAFFLAAACLAPGSDVTAERVSLNATRVGFVDVLRRMGAAVETREAGAAYREPVGEIAARCAGGAAGAGLRATRVEPREVPALIDEIPILAAVAACAEGETRFDGVGELRVKESDRLAAIVEGLRAMGAQARVDADGETLVVVGGSPARLRGAAIDSGGDHRIAMAFAVLGLVARGETVIAGDEMITTSYPGFEATLASLREGR